MCSSAGLECYVDIVEVAGSSPASPTISDDAHASDFSGDFCEEAWRITGKGCICKN